MIDWLTFILKTDKLSISQREKLRQQIDVVVRFAPNGEVKNINTTWESLRSDTTGCTIAYSPTQFIMCGSPASLFQTNNVFGSSDILKCFHDFRRYLFRRLAIVLPSNPKLYSCSRIDITENYLLNGQDEVLNALKYLSFAETRGQNVTTKKSTVYWNKNSSRREAKAYNKFLHAKTMLKNFKHMYDEKDLENLKNILRLELKLGNKYIPEMDMRWYEMTAKILKLEHSKFFKPVLGSIDVPSKTELFNKLVKIADTENQARAAFNTFNMICTLGKELTKGSIPKSSFYRHCKLLKQAGLSSADLTSGQILPFRRQTIALGESIENWEQLKSASGNL